MKSRVTTRHHLRHTVARIDETFVRIHHVGGPALGHPRGDLDVRGDNRVTFVLIHGIGLSSHYMIPLADELAAFGEVMILDLPGASGLPAPDEAMTIANFAALIARVLDLRGIKDPILVGHSMGAQIVVELLNTARHYRRACLIGPPVNMDERSLGLVTWRYLESAMYEEARLVKVATLSYLKSAKDWFFQTLPYLMSYPIEERIKTIGSNTQVVICHGEHDHLVPDSWAGELVRRAPNARCIEIPGAAHSTLYSDDDDVAKAIASLLTAEELNHAAS